MLMAFNSLSNENRAKERPAELFVGPASYRYDWVTPLNHHKFFCVFKESAAAEGVFVERESDCLAATAGGGGWIKTDISAASVFQHVLDKMRPRVIIIWKHSSG